MNADAMRRVGLIFRKELRENAKWAGVAIVVLTLVEALIVGAALNGQATTDAWTKLYFLMAIVGPLFGFALGFLQIVPERARDRWAFLVHRPATSEEILIGKALAGACLIVVALGVPLGGFALLASIPGRMAGPFDARLMEYGIALMGVTWCCELLGITSACRSARWYGSKLMPLPVGIGALMLVTVCASELTHALLWLVAVGTVGFLGALSSFSPAAGSHARPTGRRFACAAVLTVGIWLAAQIMMIIVTMCLESGHSHRISGHEYSVTSDGTVVAVTYPANGSSVSIIPSSTAPIGGPENRNPRVRPYGVADLVPMAETLPGEFTEALSLPNYDDPTRYAQLLHDGTDIMSDPVHWYLYRGMVVGYSARTCQPVALIAKSGFRPIRSLIDTTRADKFTDARSLAASEASVEGSYFAYLVTAEGIFRMDYDYPAIAPIYTGSDARFVRWIAVAQSRDLSDQGARYILATPQTIHVLDMKFHELYAIQRTLPSSMYSSLKAGMLGNGDLALIFEPSPSNSQSALPTHILVYDTVGRPVANYSLPRLPTDSGADTHSGLCWAIVAGTPLADTIMVGWYRIAHPNESILNAETLSDLHTYFVGEALLILVGLMVTWLIARRCALGRRETLAWMLGNAVIGWPGVFVMLAMRPLPAREMCVSCGRLRVVNRETCERCGASWPPPKADGTDIFDRPQIEREYAQTESELSTARSEAKS